MDKNNFTPLSYYLNSNTLDFLDLPDGALEDIGLLDIDIDSDEIVKDLDTHTDTFFDDYEGKDVTISWVDAEVERRIKINAGLAIAKELSFEIPGIDGVELVLAATKPALASPCTLTFSASDQGTFEIAAGVTLKIRFSGDLLTPMTKKVGSHGKTQFVEDKSLNNLNVEIGEVDLKVDSDGNLSFTTKAGFSINRPVMIGSTGVIIDELSCISFNFDGKGQKPQKAAAEWKGIYIGKAKVYIPDIMDGSIGAEKLGIGSGGFYGEIQYSGAKIKSDMFGMPGSVSSIAIELVQSVPTKAAIKGAIKLPFFDEPTNIEIGIALDGAFTVMLDSSDGLYELRKKDLLSFQIDSLGFEIKDKVFTANLSGQLTPLLGTEQGLNWPSFKVDELRIDSNGNVHLEGGWLNLREQYSLDFHGFQFEITKLGFGKTDDGGKWIGFSGSLKLVDGLPAGGSVEGLRITWYEDGKEPGISFEGVGVEFEVPDVLRFKGAVAYRELPDDVHRFDGAIKLELTTLDLEIDGQLVVGKEKGYTFFAIYLGLELPAGIPLWSTGLGLYGMAGLFAYQMEPDKKNTERWYGIGKEDSYYHRAPEGVVQLTKWINKQGSLGVGGGVTIGTISDNGFLFSGRVLLAIVFPGPRIFIEGKANLLKDRSSLDEEPIFRALAVLDNREGTFLIGVDAEYKYGSGGELIEIGGSAEAFFSLNDASAWHLYLGEKEPRDKRIRARILKLFESNSYFMLDANQLAFGSWVGYDRRWKFGPLRVTVEAWMENNVKLSWTPSQLYGDFWLHGKGELAIWWFELGLGLDAGIAADVFDPFHLLGKFSVSINLPWPLPDPGVTIVLEWGPDLDTPPLPVPLKEIAVEHKKVTTSWPLPREGGEPLLLPNFDAKGNGYLVDPTPTALKQKSAAFINTKSPTNAPVVPLDCRPQITFTRPVSDDAQIAIPPQPADPEWERIGDPDKDEGPVSIRYGLKEISLDKWVGGKNPWKPVAWAKENDKQNLYGSWAPVPAIPDKGGKSVAQNKLRLWSKTPFDFTEHGGSAWDEWFTDRFSDYPCVNIPPDLETCYDFEDLDTAGSLSSPWHHPSDSDLVFYWTAKVAPSIVSLAAPVGGKTKGLCYANPLAMSAKTETKIALPQPAKKVTIIASDKEVVEVRGYDAAGQEFGPFYGNRAGVQTVVLTGKDITRIAVRGYLQTCIIEVCITIGLPKQEIVRRQEMEKHLRDELVRWEQEDDILEPYTTYRLKVVTTLDTKDFAYGADFNAQRDLTEFVYFRTEGPPGLTRLSIPQGTSNDEEAALRQAGDFIVVDDSGKERTVEDLKDPKDGKKLNERLVLKSELNDLTDYVYQTVPATVPASGKQPSLPRPVYRAYDIGVEFNENYVDLMYRIVGRDLGLYMYDNNNQPVRDAEERLIVLSNRWGQAETVRLTKTDIKTITLFNASKCAPLTKDKPRNKTLNVTEERHVLDGDTVYEARLVPLLLHEEFTDDLAGWKQLDANSNVVMHSAPSDWKGHKTLKGKKATAKKNVVSLDGQPDLSKLTGKLDIIIFDEDEKRASGRYKIQTVDNKANTVSLDGEPKLKGGSSTWVIPSAVVQLSNIWGGEFARNDPVKPGTMLLHTDDSRLPKDHPDQPSRWTDYRFSAYLRTTDDDDAIGIVFRCPETLKRYPKNYYLFAMDREGRYRRLIRVVDGVHTILAEDDFVYQEDYDYLVTVEAIGASIRVYQNGVQVFSVTDSTFECGTIGFYTWGNMRARFSSPRVDDFRKQAPTVYRFKFTTSHFANFFHQLHSYQDETWLHIAPAGVNVNALLSKGVSPKSKPSNDEARDYAALVSQLFGQGHRQKPEQLQITQIKQVKDTADAIALLVESPEPIDWQRTDLEVLYAEHSLRKPKIPNAAKLTDVTFGKSKPNEESVSLLLRDTTDLTDCRIEYWRMPGPMTEASSAVLFKDQFDTVNSGLLFREAFGPNCLDHYTIEDEGSELGPSRWIYERSPAGGYIVQTSSIYGGSVSGSDREQPGTVAVTGSVTWTDVRIRVTLRSGSSGAIGIVFGYQSRDHWYRLSMDDRGRCVTGKANGTLKVLWRDQISCDRGRPYSIVIEAFGDRIIGYVDDMLLFSVQTDTIPAGKVGLFSWKNDAAIFDDLAVERLEKNPLLWQPSFTDLANWDIVDDPNAIKGPSVWKAENGVLHQTSHIHVPDTVLPSIWLRAGTYVLGGDARWEDIKISVRVRSDQDGVIGLMFRATPRLNSAGEEIGHDYYRLSFDYKAGVWRLIKVVDAVLMPLAWGKVKLSIGQTYDLSIRAVGTTLAAYLEGTQLFTRYDSDLKTGQIGLHSWANPGARFEQLVITDQTRYVGQWIVKDEGTLNAPSIWRIANGALLQTSDISGGGSPDYPGTYTVAGNPSWTDYRLSAQMRSDDDDAIGLIFRYVDVDNYYRVLLDQQGNHWWLTKKENGKIHILDKGAKAYTVGEVFTLTIDAIGNRLVGYLGDDRLFDVMDSSHTTGQVGIYSWDNNGVRIESVNIHQPPLEAYALFRDRFADASTAGFSFVDEGSAEGPANWHIFDGALRQTSNTHTPEAAKKLDKKGTYALCGDPTWSDVIISTRLASHDNDAIGLMFRYRDKDNYLRLSMDNDRRYCRLVKNLGGKFSLLWSSHFVYEPKRAYDVTIIAVGETVRGYLDGVPMFTVDVEDHYLHRGAVGAYCWGNDDTRISQVRVYPAHLLFADWLLKESFDGALLPASWQFTDEHGKDSAAHWNATKGRLFHQSQHTPKETVTSQRERPARIAVGGDASWTDYRFSAQSKTNDGDVGFLFRYTDTNNFYGVFFSRFQRGRRTLRLIARHKGQTGVLKETQVPCSEDWECMVTVDCVGPTLSAYVDGVELFAVEDDRLSAGHIGLYCEPETKASFAEVQVSRPVWSPYYVFKREESMPAGTRLRVYAGNRRHASEEEPGIVRRFVARLGETGQLRLPGDGVSLRLSKADGNQRHSRRFLPTDVYTTLPTAGVLRNADATGFFFVPTAADSTLKSGQYRLAFTYRRDNRDTDPDSQVFSQAGIKAPESVSIDVAWKTTKR